MFTTDSQGKRVCYMNELHLGFFFLAMNEEPKRKYVHNQMKGAKR
jgi:hypothetical protein